MHLVEPCTLPPPTGRLSINCPVLNGWLKGGLLVPGVTEIVGTSAAGKTQICMQLSLCAQLPAEQGGLDGGALTTREGGREGGKAGWQLTGGNATEWLHRDLRGSMGGTVGGQTAFVLSSTDYAYCLLI